MAAELIATTATKKVYRDGDKAIKVFNADFPKAEVLNEALITARVPAELTYQRYWKSVYLKVSGPLRLTSLKAKPSSSLWTRTLTSLQSTWNRWLIFI